MPRHKCKTIYTGVLFLLLIIFLASSLKSSRPKYIYDVNEHIQSVTQADLLVAANNSEDIRKTILLPSSIETLTLNGNKSFTGYKENTDELFKIVDKYPDHFVAFCTVSPLDAEALPYLKSCIKKGGKGLMLYNGHTYYHDIFDQPLNSPSMAPIYAYAEKNRLPVTYHVNITNYGQELEEVLQTYPNLIVSVPHYMISSAQLSKVTQLLDKYPNLYTDTSFGALEYMAAGFRRISQDPGGFAKFFNDYQDRIMFGIDAVLTESTSQDQTAIEEIIGCYKDVLQSRRFTCGGVSSFYEQELLDAKNLHASCTSQAGADCEALKKKYALIQQKFDEVTGLNGLGLSDAVLSKVYWENAVRFLEGK